ncbi:penicillin-binding protein 1C [Ancylobacter lacus]|uniref:penicillin-binding protein 1C n=1 Tax=Ancylobacter lacus TaxID=2579970 RepID=UPI001BCCBDAF|nr:penicillin-binding protein 1C [Ancylobacter lacus]MBS7541352.1 penicillin-binding protein 1C [Ancylobacter lacus]
MTGEGGAARYAWWQRAAAALLLASAIFAGGTYAWLEGLRASAPPVAALVTSAEVLDRDGRLLRAFPLANGSWRLAAAPEEVDRRYLALLLAYEDRRFYKHLGVDPVALARAALQFLRHGRVVSGGSTLTMQVARLLEPRRDRSLAAKWAEICRAIQLEARLSKDEILSLYLALAPFGGNLEGVRAASLAYFGKEPRRLTLGEAALLVALPQAPESRRPDRDAAAARHARDRVLQRLERQGLFGEGEATMARAAAVPGRRRDMPAFAPHATETARRERPAALAQRLAIDRNLQERLEDLVRQRVSTLPPGVSLAVLVADNASGEILARVSGADPADRERAGAVDLTRAVRSPGSTLKPFIYGLAFEDGAAHPETLIEDRPTRFGAYAPENFDLEFQGTVPVKTALQLSLNVPAVALLQAVGPQRLATRLTAAGTRLVLPAGEAPGLAVGLGGVGVRLEDLVALYADIARGGAAQPLAERPVSDIATPAPPPAQRLMSPVAAWYLAQTLSGTPPPENAQAGLIAFKTGTSFGYRDAWSIGFDGRRTIGVWVGRPDGQPVPGMIGRQVAAPVLFDAFARVAPRPAPLPGPPRGTLVARNTELPPPLRRFGAVVRQESSEGPRIAFPPDGASLALDADVALALKVSGGTGPLTVLVDGVPEAAASSPERTLFWRPAGPGFVRLTVMDAAGLSDSVVVRVQ